MSNENKIISLTTLPLNKFVVGQDICIRYAISGGHVIFCNATFIGIEKGLVKVKITNVITPDWYHFYWVAEKYPDCIGKFRVKNCYVWGKDEKDHWNRCHWFKNITEPSS